MSRGQLVPYLYLLNTRDLHGKPSLQTVTRRAPKRSSRISLTPRRLFDNGADDGASRLLYGPRLPPLKRLRRAARWLAP
jgi:hypothetical protein